MTKDPKIPANYQTVMPYLILKNAVGFIEFTKKVFGATETMKFMRDENTVMHAEIMIRECTIMFADSTEEFDVRTSGFFVYVDDADASYQLALDAGASIVTPVSEQSYGRSGGVLDPFGNTWWVTAQKFV